MANYTAGTAGDYAEIIIDYKKKTVKLVNARNNKEFKDNKYIPDHSLGTLFKFVLVYGLFIFIRLPYPLWFTVGLYIVDYVIGIVYYPAYKDWWKKLGQRIQLDWGERKLVKIKKLNKKIYSLPYEFHNNKLDYRLWGEYAKYIRKVHIKPKDYWLKTGKNIERQIRDWDALFYFTKKPKKGKMEIEFI